MSRNNLDQLTATLLELQVSKEYGRIHSHTSINGDRKTVKKFGGICKSAKRRNKYIFIRSGGKKYSNKEN